MKLRKYNEAAEHDDNMKKYFSSDWYKKISTKPTKDYDMLYLKTIFPEVLEDTKDLLDEYFVDTLDRDAKTSISKVNKADHVGFYGRYRIVGNYAKGDKTLSGYAATFNGLSNDFLDIETGLKHLQAKFRDESIFGEEFPITAFTHTLNVTHNDRGISYEFILDMKF